jgi:hypothetical protein
MPEAPRDSADGLSARVRQFAAERRAEATEPTAWRDAAWTHSAERSADVLARILEIDRARIQITPDPLRAENGWRWPRLTVTEPDGATHIFLAAFGDPRRLLALGPCPECPNRVPFTAIRHLADLGDLLEYCAGIRAEGTEPVGYLPEMFGDPGHREDCPFRRTT